jgi:hypothetical protein
MNSFPLSRVNSCAATHALLLDKANGSMSNWQVLRMFPSIYKGTGATIIDLSLFPVSVPSTFPSRTMSFSGPPSGIPGVNQSFVDTARAHACLASVTFLIVLPLGVLVPRYFRTFTTKSVVPRSAAGALLRCRY